MRFYFKSLQTEIIEMKWQFQKHSYNKDIHQEIKKQKPNSCQSQKLQNIWDKLQDLSQVQDQSRNQQMPIFLDQDSVMSKHESNDSFFQTVKVLDGQVVQAYTQHRENKENNVNKHQQINKDIEQNSFQKYKQNFNYVKVQSSLGKHNNHEYLQNDSQALNNLNKGNNFLTYTFNSKQFTQNINSINGNCENDAIQMECSSEKEKKVYVIQNSTLKPSIFLKQNDLQTVSNTNSSTNKNMNFKEIQTPHQQILKQTNERLIQDNKKLFDQCIRLRKLAMEVQSKNVIKKETIIKSNEVQTITTNQISESGEWRQKYDKLSNDYKRIVIQHKVKFSTFQTENASLKQRLIKLQYDHTLDLHKLNQSSKNSAQIHQKQLYEYKQKIKQQQINIKQKIDEIVQLKTINTQKIIREDKQKLQFKFQQKLQQKQSRTNSVKSTSISCNGSYEYGSYEYGSYEYGDVKRNQVNSSDDQIIMIDKYQSLLKDKQRQITNIKVVHQAQIRKYKEMIKNMELKSSNK